jgi:hypothetical protein
MKDQFKILKHSTKILNFIHTIVFFLHKVLDQYYCSTVLTCLKYY